MGKLAINKTLLGFTLILFMLFISIHFGDKEIILPEMAALAVGCLIYQHPVWTAKPFHLFLLPSLTAIAGFLVNMLPLNMPEKLILILFIMALVLQIFKSALAPALATGLLPVITNSTSLSFIAAILGLTFILYFLIAVKSKTEKQAIAFDHKTKDTLLYFGFISCWIVLCFQVDWMFMAAIPPVIVVGFESIHKKSFPFELVYKQIISLSVAAFIGTISLHYLDNLLLIGIINIALVTLLLKVLQFKLPPAYAMSILPMVLHQYHFVFFPLQVLAMSILVLGSVYIYKNYNFPIKTYFAQKQRNKTY